MEHRLASLAGHSIAYTGPSGAADLPPLVFVHGITGSIDCMELFLPEAVRQSHQCSAVSLPCHAPSEWTDRDGAPLRPETFSDAVAAAIRELHGDEPVHLVGWSTGGFAALMTAATHPDLVRSVTSISGFARGRWGNSLGLMQAIAALGVGGLWAFRLAMAGLVRSPIAYGLTLRGYTAGGRQRPTLVRELHAGFAQHDFSAIGQAVAAIRGWDVSERLRSIAAPTLIIEGQRDAVVPAGEAAHLAQLIPGSETLEIAGCGHLFYCEAPDTVWPATTDWIARHHHD